MWDELAVVAQPVAEGDRSAEIAAAGLLVGLHLSNALADAVTLRLGKGRCDRQK
jgi:hypothetical protein